MANRTLSDLPVVTVIAGADILHTRQTLTDKSVSQSKIAEYGLTLSDYAPTVVNVTATTHTISTTKRRQLIVCTIGSNCTMTFPGAYGGAMEITIYNATGSTANVLGLPNSEVLYPGQEITFIWDGSGWIKRKYQQIMTGTTAPAVNPGFVGQIFCDTTNDLLYIATGTSATTDWILLAKPGQDIITVTADYTISDAIKSGTKFLVSCNTVAQYGVITITCPTLADNIGKWYEIEMGAAQGLIKIDGEGAENLSFKGNLIPTALIYAPGMNYIIKDNGNAWIMSGSNIMSLNWQNRSDWSNVHIGNGVTYDNGSGTSTKNTDWTGMVVTEATSNFTAVVVEDTGGAGTTGILYLYNYSTGFTFWTNNRKLTASNGQTIDINETTGTSKDIDYNLYHEFGINIKTYQRDFIFQISTDGSENNSWCIPMINHASYNTGIQLQQVDTNSAKIQSADGGSYILVSDAGSQDQIDTDNYYCFIAIDFSC